MRGPESSRRVIKGSSGGHPAVIRRSSAVPAVLRLMKRSLMVIKGYEGLIDWSSSGTGRGLCEGCGQGV